MNGDGLFHVHVDNLSEISRVTKTEEVEPQHFTTSGFILPATGTNSGAPVQILQLDPLRKRATVTFNGTGQVALCHSLQQATSMQQAQNINADEGALITCPAIVKVESTGPMWAVLAGTATASVVNPATATVSGSVTAPGAGGTIITSPALSGYYQFTVSIYIDGTVVAATDDDNMEFSYGGSFYHLSVPADSTGPVIATTVFTGSPNAAAAKVTANNAGSAAAVYHAQIAYTQLATSGASTVAVGVVQERRNS